MDDLTRIPLALIGSMPPVFQVEYLRAMANDLDRRGGGFTSHTSAILRERANRIEQENR